MALFVSLIQGLCTVAFPGRTALGSWEDRFNLPPADARILKIIHNWPDQPDTQDQYINLLMPEPTARFVDVTYGGYAQHLGDDLGKYFMATFTDELSLMSLFLRPMPYRPLPWASNLPTEFRKRRGYTLDAAILPALVVDAGSAGAKIRYDFWLTVGELVSENYFGQIQTCCRQHGVPSGGHLLAEEGIVGHVPLYGDFFRCIRRLDAPSIDCLTSVVPEVPWFIARLLSSAAELEDRPLVMSETSDHSHRYRPKGGDLDYQRRPDKSGTIRCCPLPLHLREAAPATYRHRRGIAEPRLGCRAGSGADHGAW